MSTDNTGKPLGLKIGVGIPLVILLGAFPVAQVNVFMLGGDRLANANFLAIAYLIGLYGMFLAPWMPWSGISHKKWYEKLETTIVIWLWVVYLTAIVWELPWLMFHEVIRDARDEMWAYTWWAYIDGGDFRYTGFDPTIATLEGLTIFNAFIGLGALWFWLRSKRQDVRPLFIFMLTGASHSYQTFQYYISQALVGFEAVGDTWFDLVVRFFLVNSPWALMPILVWIWATNKIMRRISDVPDTVTAAGS